MAAIRRTIDPQTRDYVVQAGDYQDDGTSLVSKAAFLWRLRKGSASAFPDLGNRFHEVRTASEADARLVEHFALEAWRPLLRAGEMRDPRVEAWTSDKPGLILLRGEFRARSGKVQILEHSVLVGEG